MGKGGIHRHVGNQAGRLKKPKTKKKEIMVEKKGNVKSCSLLLNNSANGPVVIDKKEKRCKRKKEAAITSHKDRPTWM